jgi:hypothetical protein
LIGVHCGWSTQELGASLVLEQRLDFATHRVIARARFDEKGLTLVRASSERLVIEPLDRRLSC